MFQLPDTRPSKLLPDASDDRVSSGERHTTGTHTEPSREPENEERLAASEQTIERGRSSAFETGAALRDIRDGRLYRQAAQTFEEYCRQRWDMSRDYAYKLIDCSEVCGLIVDHGLHAIKSERQSRELARLRDDDGGIDADKVAEAWSASIETAKSTGQPITAKLIRTEVAKVRGDEPPAPKPTKIERGIKVTRHLSTDELRQVLDFLRRERPDAFDVVRPEVLRDVARQETAKGACSNVGCDPIPAC
jgi:hypothetical protein